MDYYGEGKGKTLTLRITADMMDAIDQARGAGSWSAETRGQWVREAIRARLQALEAGKSNGDKSVLDMIREETGQERITDEDPDDGEGAQ